MRSDLLILIWKTQVVSLDRSNKSYIIKSILDGKLDLKLNCDSHTSTVTFVEL